MSNSKSPVHFYDHPICHAATINIVNYSLFQCLGFCKFHLYLKSLDIQNDLIYLLLNLNYNKIYSLFIGGYNESLFQYSY